MHQNRLWLMFLAVVVVVSLGYTVRTAFLVMKFYSYQERYPVKTLEWSHYEDGEHYFYPVASYMFDKRGELIKKKELLPDFKYTNPYRLDEEILQFKERSWEVFCRSDGQCTLHNGFPYKEVIYTLILLAISVYFVYLGISVNQFVKRRK